MLKIGKSGRSYTGWVEERAVDSGEELGRGKDAHKNALTNVQWSKKGYLTCEGEAGVRRRGKKLRCKPRDGNSTGNIVKSGNFLLQNHQRRIMGIFGKFGIGNRDKRSVCLRGDCPVPGCVDIFLQRNISNSKFRHFKGTLGVYGRYQ